MVLAEVTGDAVVLTIGAVIAASIAAAVAITNAKTQARQEKENVELQLLHDRDLQDKAELRDVLDDVAVAIGTATRLAGTSVSWAELDFPFDASNAQEQLDWELHLRDKEDRELRQPRTDAFHEVFAQGQRLVLRVGQGDVLAEVALTAYERISDFSDALPDGPISDLTGADRVAAAERLDAAHDLIVEAQYAFLTLAQERVGTLV